MEIVRRGLLAAVAAFLGIASGAMLQLHVFSSFYEAKVLEVKNRSGLTIKEAAAEICDHKLHLVGLAPGGSAAMRYRIKCDTHYGLKVELESGKRLALDGIYVASGLGGHDVFTVRPSAIELGTGPLSADGLASSRVAEFR